MIDTLISYSSRRILEGFHLFFDVKLRYVKGENRDKVYGKAVLDPLNGVMVLYNQKQSGKGWDQVGYVVLSYQPTDPIFQKYYP